MVDGGMNVVRHVRGLWPGGWGVLAPLPFVLWPILMLLSGERRWDYIAFPVVCLGLAYGTPSTKRLFVGLYPIGLLALVYDGMRFVKDVGLTTDNVHLCDLEAANVRLFGNVPDWLQLHSSLTLDVLCAIPYGTFIFATLGFAVYLYTKDQAALRRFGWTFLLVNVAGFVTYHLYPAAPPWYFHAHGCTVDLAAQASEGPNLTRVDAWLGVKYFAGVYGRSSDVFGSVPSLHVAYPMLVALSGWRAFGKVARALSVVFLVSMCFSAVYLDHHWVSDVVLGLLYSVIGFVFVEALATKPWQRIEIALATWFGCGYVPLAPGTAGTLGAVPLYLVLRPHGAGAVLSGAIVLTVVGIWVASRFARRTGLHDPQNVVIDEVAGVHVTWLAAPATWQGLVAGFVLFRIFDQLKPFPARWAERELRGGMSIVLDDVFAGVWGAMALGALRLAGVV
jgi:inositol phosphorylceramide synthase catalytic subunit